MKKIRNKTKCMLNAGVVIGVVFALVIPISAAQVKNKQGSPIVNETTELPELLDVPIIRPRRGQIVSGSRVFCLAQWGGGGTTYWLIDYQHIIDSRNQNPYYLNSTQYADGWHTLSFVAYRQEGDYWGHIPIFINNYLPINRNNCL